MRSTPLAEGEPWPRLCAAELGGLRRLRRKHGCKSFRVELKVLSGRRPGLRAPLPPPPAVPPPAWEPRSAALGAASAFPAAPPPPPPAARPPPPPPAASPRPRPGEASGVSPEIKALQQTRRLLANARERTRVHTISAAFEALRKQVPCYSYGQKLSKLAILRIACNYILSLARLADLDYSADHSNMSFSECVEQCTRTLQAEGRSKKRKVLITRKGGFRRASSQSYICSWQGLHDPDEDCKQLFFAETPFQDDNWPRNFLNLWNRKEKRKRRIKKKGWECFLLLLSHLLVRAIYLALFPLLNWEMLPSQLMCTVSFCCCCCCCCAKDLMELLHCVLFLP
ncbi:transcription factor ATOH8 isoform 1-T1 [Porphyrio hochstetteri]